MRVATLQSKLVPVLTMDDARDMFSRDATTAFRERRRLKAKKTLQRICSGGDHRHK